jgi:acetoin:2,6-dichlorophenolindophenol oxidoreductase subunit beta
MRQLSYCDAINEAMFQEMERDDSVFVYGIGVPDHKKIFGTTKRLLETFGPDRCFDTPLAEDAMTGFGLGAALGGLRPIHIHIRVDFLLLAMNQLVNIISTYNYSTLGKLGVPLVIRVIVGRGWGQGYQHSKTLQSWLAHIPGLKVIMPTTPADAKGLLIAAIRDNSPVVCIEHRWLYSGMGDVAEESYTTPIGRSAVLREGTDATVLATSWMNIEALKASAILEKRDVHIEIIDPRTIAPFDDTLVIASTKKTGHCIVADTDWLNCGFSAEVATRVYESCFRDLQSPIIRIGFAATPCPTVRNLEDEFYPNAIDIIRAVETQLGIRRMDLSGEEFYSYENQFKGPF